MNFSFIINSLFSRYVSNKCCINQKLTCQCTSAALRNIRQKSESEGDTDRKNDSEKPSHDHKDNIYRTSSKTESFFPRDIATRIIRSVSVKYIKRKYSTVLINHWDLNKRQMNPAVWVPELLRWPLPSAAVLHTANEAGTRGFQLTSPLTGIVGFLHYY